MSDSIIIPSYTAINYSYTDSVVPSSVFTSYSLPRHHAAAYDDEADYPLNYEASPIHQTSDDHDAFPSSLLTSADVDNKESSIYDCHVNATVTESELFESQQKSFHDTTSAIATNETSSIAYRNMKMKYLRSAGVAIPRGVVGAHAAARRLSSSPSYDVTYDEEVEETRGRTESSSSSPLSISSSSSSSAASSAAPSPVPKSNSIGLLARLLSERVPTAPSTPTTLSPSSSSTSLVSMSSPSSPVAAATSVTVDASSAAATPYVRRTSPISIPKRIPARGDDTDGVRYRRARQPTRDELDEEERDRQQRLDNDDMYDSRTIAGRRVVDDGEFTFADVFAVPLATSSRAIAINNKKPTMASAAASARRLPVIPAGSSFSMGVSHALPSSLIDGFLAL